MFKNALISVSDKSGLIEFVKPLAGKGMRVVSTGGTAKFLRENGINVVDVSEQTHFPEVMGGRVKTLHPHIHMAILARGNVQEDIDLLKKQELQPFDLVICNLYPFEQSVLKKDSDEELIENIDIGGPTLLRAAAKNHEAVTVLCHPEDYSWVMTKQSLSQEDRRRLAAKVFAHVASYDSLVAKELGLAGSKEFPFAGRRAVDLRYGENPHQYAGWFRNLADESGLHSAEIIQGKPLSYNNILDLDAASCLAKLFQEKCAVAVKHNNPCGVGTHKFAAEAVNLALQADPVSVFGGIIACNFTVDPSCAEKMQNVFLECVIAPNFTKEALQIFSAKKNLRILKWPKMQESEKRFEIRTVVGGFLLQETDQYFSQTKEWKFLSDKPTDAILQDLFFAEKVCAALKSNSIAIVKNGQTLGLGMGQVNRVEAVQHAIARMQAHHKNTSEVVMASDAFFPFTDSVELAVKAGVKWILQPGGSIKDQEVFEYAKKVGVNMIITGTRHFRH